MDANRNQLLADYEEKYTNVISDPESFLNSSISDLETKFDKKFETHLDKARGELVEIHQKLYLYYYTHIDNKYPDLIAFFKNTKNENFKSIFYNIFNNHNTLVIQKELINFRKQLNELYNSRNKLKVKIYNFLYFCKLVSDRTNSFKDIINILRLKNGQRIYISSNTDEKHARPITLSSTKTTANPFLETILRTKDDITYFSTNITSSTNKKGYKNHIKQLLYFCQVFKELKLKEQTTGPYDNIILLKKNYDNLISELNAHILNFKKEEGNAEYAINKLNTSFVDTLRRVNVMKDALNKLKKYILNESLIDKLITEYSDELKAEELKEVVKSEIKANKKEFTDIPPTTTEKIEKFDTETLLTPFNKATSKGLEYLNTVIIIIIFLIFLNLFITTYFYFTTSIQATANRSNCGGASLCEAETHRHLFLEDNGNDKARDIYIIIVVIFSIYLLSEIFKSYSEDVIKFDDDNNIGVPIFVLCGYFIFIVGTIGGIRGHAKSNDTNDTAPADINVVSSVLFMLYLLAIGIIFFNRNNEVALYDAFITISTGIMAFLTIGVEIGLLARGSKNDLFKGFSGDDDFNLINPKFKAHTALHIIFLVFYIIFFGVVLGLGFNKNIKSLHIWGLVFLAFILFTLFIFILLASLDFKHTNYTKWLKNIKHSTSSMQYFVLLAPLLISLDPSTFKLNISANAIKLIVLYYVILFIIYLFYVYFLNHSNEIGILSLESFQLYNWASEAKNEGIKGSNNEQNYKKEVNKANTGFVFILLIILIGIGGLNEDPNLDNIIYGIIVFILASYITGIVYLLYNTVFPIQQASFKYKKNLVDINNEISQHIKVEEVEHTIDKNKIRVFKIANDPNELQNIQERIRGDGTTNSKEKHMKNIRDIFSEISPKGSSYEDYRSQSTDQMQYEEYIYLLFNNDNNSNAINQYNYDYYSNLLVEKNKDDSFYEVPSLIAPTNKDLYNQIILNIPNTLIDIGYDIDVKYTNIDTAYLSNLQLNIPKANNIEYVIKKNYKYVTGEEGEIQKYNVLSDKELDCLYYKEVTTGENKPKLEESIKAIKNITDLNKLTITNIATVTTTKHTDANIDDKTIYKLNQDIFDHYKNEHTKSNDIIIKLGSKKYQNIRYDNITPIEYEKLNPAFYTIGYDYENYTYKEEDHQQMNKDTAYSIPARYYACSYLNYFPNEDGSMSKVKFAKNIKEDNYNPLNAKNTIIDRIAKSYNANAKETKIQLAPEKFQFLLVFLVILAIILLMFLFNIIKKYFTGDVYTPQMYVLGILGVFLTIFIFGEVIFARIK